MLSLLHDFAAVLAPRSIAPDDVALVLATVLL
jgi:hypothetical protein